MAVLVLVAAAALGTTGCVTLRMDSGPTEDGPPLETTSAPAPVANTDSPPAAAGVATRSADPSSAPRPSQASIDYAENLGGKSHFGETLYFVVGQSLDSERAALDALEKAKPLFGDMQDYFIVQRSDNFYGMRPGWWIIAEAYRVSPSEDNLQFARRAFPDAYVRQATVNTRDPIPVYDDIAYAAP